MTEQALLEKLDNLANVFKLGKSPLWDVAALAAYFNVATGTVRDRIIIRADFPAPIQVIEGQKGRRWKPDDVEQWAESHRAIVPRGRNRSKIAV